jgi:hypothetical protein
VDDPIAVALVWRAEGVLGLGISAPGRALAVRGVGSEDQRFASSPVQRRSDRHFGLLALTARLTPRAALVSCSSVQR